jgi:hypothetical protein
LDINPRLLDKLLYGLENSSAQFSISDCTKSAGIESAAIRYACYGAMPHIFHPKFLTPNRDTKSYAQIPQIHDCKDVGDEVFKFEDKSQFLTCFEKTAISSLNDSELHTSPPASTGVPDVHKRDKDAIYG